MNAGLRTPAPPPSPSFVSAGLGASEKDSTPAVVKGILGGSVILSLNISVDTEIEHITWSGPQEALALADAKGKIILIDKSYQGRINVTQNNSLSINKLTLKDAGSYKAQINQKNSEVTTSEKFTLSIYGEFQRASVGFDLLFLKAGFYPLQELISLGQRELSHWSFSPNFPLFPQFHKYRCQERRTAKMCLRAIWILFSAMWILSLC